MNFKEAADAFALPSGASNLVTRPHATIPPLRRRDRNRTDELAEKVSESLAPRLSKLPGFADHLIEAGNGVIGSVGVFESVEQADESTRVAAAWVRDEKLEMVLQRARGHQRRSDRHQNGVPVLAEASASRYRNAGEGRSPDPPVHPSGT